MPTTIEASVEDDYQLETTLPMLVPHPIRFHREVYQIPEASSSRSEHCLFPAPTATISSSQEPSDEHLPPGETSLPVEVHSPEFTEPVLPPCQK